MHFVSMYLQNWNLNVPLHLRTRTPTCSAHGKVHGEWNHITADQGRCCVRVVKLLDLNAVAIEMSPFFLLHVQYLQCVPRYQYMYKVHVETVQHNGHVNADVEASTAEWIKASKRAEQRTVDWQSLIFLIPYQRWLLYIACRELKEQTAVLQHTNSMC